MKAQLFLALLLFVFSNLSSQHESLDSTFGINGVIETCPVKAYADEYDPRFLFIDHEDQILVCGFSTISGLNYPLAIRYSKDGVLDQKFYDNMKSSENLSKNCRTYCIAVSESGNIVFGGQYLLNSAVLLQYDKNGILDLGFGDKGRVFINSFNGDESIYKLTLQSDGKILVAGSGKQNNENVNFISRYLQGGNIDSTFSHNGTLFFNGSGQTLSIDQILYLKNNKILITGQTAIKGTSYITRLNLDGSFDSNFGKQGIILFTLDTTNTVINAIKEDVDNNIVLGGELYYGDTHAFSSKVFCSKFLKDGSVDLLFGNNGYVFPMYSLGSQYENILDITFSTNEQIMITGFAGGLYIGNNILLKLLKNGQIDYKFGENGYLLSNSGDESAGVSSKIQSSGNIILLASAYDTSVHAYCIFLYRYKINNLVNSSNDDQKYLSFYPSIVNKNINININDFKSNYTYSIFNCYGQRVLNGLILNDKSIECTSLASGIYNMVIRSEKEIILSKKIIKI